MNKKKAKKARRRSGEEICPICKNKAILIEHHINGRKIPNANASWNLIESCSACHDRIHAGHIIVEGWVTTTSGRELVWRPAEEDRFLPGSDPDIHIF